MALTAEERKELEQLEAEFSTNSPAMLDTTSQSGDQTVNPGVIEATARGAAQGATLNTADEITGAIESALTDKTYEQARDESRKAYEAASEENPLAYFAGELGGSLAVPVPGANKILGASKGLDKLLRTSAISAGVTGGSALGASTQENMSDALSEAAGPALGGAIIAPALMAGVPAAAKLGADLSRKIPTTRDLPYVFRKSYENPEFMSLENTKKVNEELRNITEKEVLPLLTDDVRSAVTKEYDRVIDSAPGKLDAKELRQDISRAFSPEVQAIADDPTLISEKVKSLGLLDTITGRKEIQVPIPKSDSIEKAEQAAASKLENVLAKDNKKIQTKLENESRQEAEELLKDFDAPPEVKDKVVNSILERKSSELDALGTPVIVKETDAMTGKDMMVLRYTMPDGRVVAKPEIVKAAIDSQTMEVISKPDLDARDVWKIRERAGSVLDNAQGQGNSDLFDAALRLKKATEIRLKDMGVDLAPLSEKRVLQDEIAARAGVSTKPASIENVASRRVTEGRKLAKDFVQAAYKPQGIVATELLKDTPESLKKLGLLDPKKIDETIEKAREKGKEAFILNTSTAESPLTTTLTENLAPGLALTFRGKANQTAGVAGSASRKLVDGVSSVINADPLYLTTAAKKLGNTAAGRALTSIVNQPEGKRKALLFTFMQQPAYREAMEGLDLSE